MEQKQDKKHKSLPMETTPLLLLLAVRKVTMLCPIKFNSNTIVITVQPFLILHLVLDLLYVKKSLQEK